MLSMVDDKRFEMRISSELLAAIDTWRHQLPVVPPRAAAVKQLLAVGLETVTKRKETKRSAKK